MVDEASNAFSGVFPDLAETSGNIDDLNKSVKEHKTSLRLMENQLSVTSRERDAVLRRMEALQRDVNDIESLLDIVEKSRELVAASDSNDYAEKTLKANSCIQVKGSLLIAARRLKACAVGLAAVSFEAYWKPTFISYQRSWKPCCRCV